MKKQKNIFLTTGGVLILSLSLLIFPLFSQVSYADSQDLNDLFTASSFDFNPELAKLSLNLSNMAYGETSELAESTLKSLGFENDRKYDAASYSQSEKVDSDSVAYSLAHKKISSDGKAYDLIALVIRGTHSDNEWLSNFNINNSGDYPLAHEGFSKAEKAVLGSLQRYAASLGATPDSTKLLITGHSRGAAVANLLAADLMGDSLPYAESIATPSNIFTYTFATPNVAVLNLGSTHANEGSTKDSTVKSTQNFLNIFNAVDSADIITHMPFTSWGYGKYGVNYTIPEFTTEQKTSMAVTAQVLSKFSALAPTVSDFYKQQLGAVFLEGSQIPASCMTAHAIASYVVWLNNADSAALEKQVLKNQLMLIPDENYA